MRHSIFLCFSYQFAAFQFGILQRPSLRQLDCKLQSACILQFHRCDNLSSRMICSNTQFHKTCIGLCASAAFAGSFCKITAQNEAAFMLHCIGLWQKAWLDFRQHRLQPSALIVYSSSWEAPFGSDDSMRDVRNIEAPIYQNELLWHDDSFKAGKGSCTCVYYAHSFPRMQASRAN